MDLVARGVSPCTELFGLVDAAWFTAASAWGGRGAVSSDVWVRELDRTSIDIRHQQCNSSVEVHNGDSAPESEVQIQSAPQPHPTSGREPRWHR